MYASFALAVRSRDARSLLNGASSSFGSISTHLRRTRSPARPLDRLERLLELLASDERPSPRAVFALNLLLVATTIAPLAKRARARAPLRVTTREEREREESASRGATAPGARAQVNAEARRHARIACAKLGAQLKRRLVDAAVPRREPTDADDACAICLALFADDKSADLSYCKYGCGENTPR